MCGEALGELLELSSLDSDSYVPYSEMSGGYSRALIDFCGTKVKHEALAHSLTNLLLLFSKI